MPLIKGKSEKPFKSNVKEMMNAGHPMKQSLAAAYSMKRRSARKMADGGVVKEPKQEGMTLGAMIGYPGADRTAPRKMAMGGMADSEMEAGMPGKEISLPMEKDELHQEQESNEMGRGMAHGGEMEDSREHYNSIADAILAKNRNAKMMADGGQVDIELNAQEEDMNAADGENQEAALKENYDEGMGSMVDRIRRKRMMG